MSTPRNDLGELLDAIRVLFPDAHQQPMGEITLARTDGPNGYVVDLSRMLFNWRLTVTTPELHGTAYLHGYCYFGTGADTMHRALAAAHDWIAFGHPLETHPPLADKQAY